MRETSKNITNPLSKLSGRKLDAGPHLEGAASMSLSACFMLSTASFSNAS